MSDRDAPTDRGMALLMEATEDACAQIMQRIRLPHPVNLNWQAQRAPGSRMAPAEDARQVASLLDGWTKVSVPSKDSKLQPGDQYWNTLCDWKSYTVPDAPHDVEVSNVAMPDQWDPGRTYHHAWYVAQLEYRQDGRTYWLRFDAVAHTCAVFVNGLAAGRHVGGYTPFEFELTPLLQDGINAIAIHVQDETAVLDVETHTATSQLDHGRGAHNAHMAGIRGGIYLEARQPIHVDRVRLRTTTRTRRLTAQVWLRGHADDTTIRHAIYEWPNGDRPVMRLPQQSVSDNFAEVAVDWPDAKWWSPAHPNLYVLRTTLVADGKSESFDTRFGFREFRIDGRQFILNDKPIRLFGDSIVRWQLLSIVPESARDYNRAVLTFLKREFNFSSFRLHAITFPAWAAQGADEAGVLVIAQSGLASSKRDWYRRAGDAFLQNTESQYAEWYWRDVNSPSVVMWDVENELIRGGRDPECLAWTLNLDRFIKQHDPDAIVQHSGAAWYHPDQQLIHVHMQEQYNRVMRTWQNQSNAIPLVLGEFWMGGRGETRLPNAYEYRDREDWHREEARLYREHMLEMRLHGVNGIMPHRLTRWPLIEAKTLLTRADCPDGTPEPDFRWRFPKDLNQGPRGLAPVIGFAWPRGASVAAGEPFSRNVIVCNDSEEERILSVQCAYADQCEKWRISLGPAEQRRLPVTFTPADGVHVMAITVCDSDGREIEHDEVAIHALSPEALNDNCLERRVVVITTAIDTTTETSLDSLKIDVTISADLPNDAEQTIALIPAGVTHLDRDAVSKYLASGGRLLVLAQRESPTWLPIELPFFSALRPSFPEFVDAGWESTNRDLMYTRELPIYAEGHPVLSHLVACDFKEWDPLDGRISDDAYSRPNAANLRAGGAYRVLLGASRRENATLVEYAHEGGTALLCQAHVLTSHNHPAARTLVYNMLRYLDGSAWRPTRSSVAVLGDAPLSAIGVRTERATRSSVFVVAGDHADVDLIRDIAASGGTVLVLSCETCARMPGYAVERGEHHYYSGTRAGVVDHPLFWGIASASFLPLQDTPACGALSSSPADAQILLGGHCLGHSPLQNDWSVDIGFFGLETREDAPPIATMQRIGKGAIIATTLEPWNRRSETHRQLLCNLLANAGVEIPHTSAHTSVVNIKSTIPLVFDGKLDDWTNDIEDINLSRHSHATPMPITSKDVDSDLEFSAVLYLLYDHEHLYLGGVVFADNHTVKLKTHINDTLVEIAPETRTIKIHDKDVVNPTLAVGRQRADELIDTHLLNLTRTHRQTGRAEIVGDAMGRTFEAAVPWAMLDCTDLPAQMVGRFELQRADGLAARYPAPRSGVDASVTLQLAEGNTWTQVNAQTYS